MASHSVDMHTIVPSVFFYTFGLIHYNIHKPKTNHVYAKYCVCFDVPTVINSSSKAILDKIDTVFKVLLDTLKIIYNSLIKKSAQL